MANALYTKGKENLLSGNFNLSSNTVKVVCVDSADYTLAITTHDALDDVAAAGRVATGTLASKTVTDGVFDAADLTFSTVSGDQFEYLIVYKDSGVESTSYLLACFDTATGLPLTPNGGDVVAQWNASGLFTL